jgi:hypothetical protein
MNFGWGPDSYAVPYGNPDVKTAYLSTPLGASNKNYRYVLQSSVAMINSRLRTINSFSFADAMSAFTNQDPADYKLDLGSTTVDPMNMSLETYQSTTPSTAGRHDSAQASSATGKTTPTEDISQTPDDGLDEEEPLQFESEITRRARYAANQRHAKARNFQKANINTINNNSHTTLAITQAAEKKKQVLREKNKVAAAKCRQRQRKQYGNIRAKGGRLSERNAQLKSYVQELQGELNGLRAVSLGHSECDDRLARYNQVQAERVMRNYYSACGSMMTR